MNTTTKVNTMTTDFETIRNTLLAFPDSSNVKTTNIIDTTNNHITIELVNNRGWVSTLGITLNNDRSVSTSIGIMFSNVENFKTLFWTVDWFAWSTTKKDIVFC